MNETEKNIAILTELYKIADEYIGKLNGVYEGMYTANQLAKYVAKGNPACASAIKDDEKNELRKVVVDTFEMTFPFGEILSILHRMESATGTGHRRYEMGDKRTRQRFYCHYNNDEGKPVRVRKELTKLVLPCLEGRPNEIWYNEKSSDGLHNGIYSRISDTECILIGHWWMNDVKNCTELTKGLKIASDIRNFLANEDGREPNSYSIAAFIRIADYEMVNILATKKAPYEAKRAEERREEEKRNAIMTAENNINESKKWLEYNENLINDYTSRIKVCERKAIEAKAEIVRLEEELKAVKLKYGVAI